MYRRKHFLCRTLLCSTPFLVFLLPGCEINVGEPRQDVPKNRQGIEEVISRPATSVEMDQALTRHKSADIIYALNEVKASPLDFDVITLIACAYSACESRNRNWNQDAIAKEIVQVNLVDVLVQASRRGIPTVDEESLLERALGFLKSPNPLVVQRAILVLAYADAHEDEPAFARPIAEVAMSTENVVTFRVAILGLKRMSGDIATAELKRILDDATVDQRAAVEDIVSL